MVSFEDAGRVLDEAADALPQEIFEKLNGGVNLLPARKADENGLLVMGMYFSDQMGRHIEIYYGSFCEAYPDATPEKAARELTKTLKHELTHHIEGLAWDRTLEKWDDRHKAELLAGLYDEPLTVDSLLFVCGDNAGLSPICEGLFKKAAAVSCPEVRCASAGLSESPPDRVNENAVRAAAEYGADISAHIPRRITREIADGFDALLCMTEEEGDALAALYPALDEKIMCLGPKDIQTPLFDRRSGWRKAADKIAEEIDYLVDELCSAEDDGDGN